DCRPPPGRRTRPRGTGSGPTSSRCPWVMVVRLIPVITENSVVPPCPFIDARRPTTRRACFSSRPAIARHTFRCSVASALRGWTLHASQPQVALLLAMPAGDHAPIHASSVQVIEFHLLTSTFLALPPIFNRSDEPARKVVSSLRSSQSEPYFRSTPESPES